MEDVHVMVNEAKTDTEVLYACPVEGCGRRLVINWLRPDLTVLDQGIFSARHVGGSEGFELGLSVR
jgi:hypothetical protein